MYVKRENSVNKIFNRVGRPGSGYVFPLILLATLAVGLFIVTVGQLSVSHKKQFNHLNQYQHSFNIAYSALVELLADVKKTKWANRKFKAKPVGYSKDLYGGSFNLLAEDYPSKDFYFNVKIRVVYHGKTNLFYWRMKYEPNMLDFNSLVIPVYFAQFDDSTAPGYLDGLDKVVDEDLKVRDDNASKAKKIVIALNDKISPKEILQTLGALPKGSTVSVVGGDDTRPPELVIVINSGGNNPKKLTDIIDETEGADTPSLGDVITSLPLTDIYPGPINVNVGLSRKEIVVYFTRLLKLPEVSSESAISAFGDINSDSIFNRALSAAYDNGLVKGYTNGNFGPDDKILRGHMAFLLIQVKDYTVNRISTPGIAVEEKNRLTKIKSFAAKKIPEYADINPTVAMTVGDGLGALTGLLDDINSGN